jgi:hypothetical protein
METYFENNQRPQCTSSSPGQQLYAWFIADSRPPHSHLPWAQLTRRQQRIYDNWAIHWWQWATDTQEPDGTHAT